MKEIKFRVWDKIHKIMHEVISLEFSEGHIYFSTPPFQWRTVNMSGLHTILLNDDFILIEYTGLKDKNGKEIYEGDIIVNKQEGHPSNAKPLAINDIRNIHRYVWEGLFGNYVEIIGNIYENSELLKEK